MCKRNIQISVLILVLMMTLSASGQMVGSPIVNPGTTEWTVSAMGGYFHQGVGSETVQSYRLLLKSSWGVTPWMDLFAMGGAADLKIELPQQNITPLKDQLRLTYGLGFNLSFRLPGIKKLSFWGGAHAIRYQPEGNFTEPTLIGSELYIRRLDMMYDWRELKIFAGIAVNVGPALLYAGGAGWWLQRLDNKSEYLQQGQTVTFIETVEGEYRSGLWTAGLLGVELRLPENFALALEVMAFNERNLQVFISLLQTGASKFKPLD